MDLTANPAFEDHLHQLQQRWETAITSTGYDMALVSAGADSTYLFDDLTHPFRANPHFAQWFPDNHVQNCELLIKPGQKPTLLFFAPSDYWHIPPSVPAWASEHFDVSSHATVADLQRALGDQLAGHNNVAQISAVASENVGVSHNPTDLLAKLDYTRARKTPFEIANLRASTQRGVAGHLAAKKAFDEGHSEYDIYMAFIAATRHTAAELPYQPIVALNEHAGVLHYQNYDQQAPGLAYSFLIDAGAAAAGYASDITHLRGSRRTRCLRWVNRRA